LREFFCGLWVVGGWMEWTEVEKVVVDFAGALGARV
jgi:hypothetical protein